MLLAVVLLAVVLLAGGGDSCGDGGATHLWDTLAVSPSFLHPWLL